MVVAEDPGYFSLISCRGFLFLLNASSFGLQASWACHFFFFRGPLAPASLDLAYFLLGLAHFFGLGHYDLFLDLKNPHLFVYHIHTTKDPKKVGRALGGG